MGWGTDPNPGTRCKVSRRELPQRAARRTDSPAPNQFMASKCKIRFSTAAVYVYGSAGGDQIPRPRVPHARVPQLAGTPTCHAQVYIHTGPYVNTRAASPSCTVPPAADGAHAASSPSGPARHTVAPQGQDGLSSVPVPPITIERLYSTRTR